ncbi:MAG: hypothetical protein JW850_14575 [Thermoflexales bacterium]|nr:hypothetical protein [Thermoflexales bacterium]
MIILAAYVALTVGMTWPTVLYLNSHFIGQNIDVWINQWATWWTEKAIFEGQSLYYTHFMFYPHGVSLAFHSFSHVNTALALLMRPLLGDLAAHNTTVLLAHAISGYAMFCLVRRLTHSAWSAFFAGLVFAFYPYRMAESVHPVLVSTQWMPFYFLFLIRLVEEGNKRNAAAAALFFVLTALSSWHLMILTVLASALYLLYLAVVERWRYSKTMLLNLALLAALTGLPLAPFLYPIVREQLTISQSYVGVELEVGKGNDLTAFLLPAEQHPVFKKLVIPVHARLKSIRAVYVGFVVIGLSLLGGLKCWKRSRFWVVLASLSMLASIDAPVQIGGNVLPITMPWSPPIIWLLRHPFRFNLLVGLGLAVSSGLGLSAALDWLAGARPGWRKPLAATTAALLLFEYLYLPFPTTPATASPYYSRLAASSEEGAVLDLPMGREPTRYYLYYQIMHGKPLVEGIVSRTSPEAYALIDTTPILRSLRNCGEDALPPAGLALQTMADNGITYVILHKQLVKQKSLDTWLDTRTADPDYEDQDIAVYSTHASLRASPGAAQLLEGCIAVRPLLTPTAPALQGQALEIPLEWIVGNSPQEEYVLELALVDATGEPRRRRYYEIVPGAFIVSWQMGKRHTAQYTFQLDSLLLPGDYSLWGSLVPLNRNKSPLLSAHVADIQIAASPAGFSPPAIYEQVVNAEYGADLRLQGYTLELSNAALHLSLDWQALRHVETDYKFFVHLQSAESQSLVAQVDARPQDWTFPTSTWQEGQIVSDEMTLGLENVPPGTYQLAIGVYDAYTGERLAITGYPPHMAVDAGRLLLPETVVRQRSER